ncbi:hypothetical protein [Aquisalibacillus elongatus]|uniref:Uncharacterized protein n=1 Tax=Aquisalibacillus elongatus TaxID=485577 RepID=A0A3N5CAW4_9BACI|nr:hypothetical protein [Aquisalibacillus elongatus]RPF53931.1 hypothetical protein EDC24_1116 [Aquisalibacillus elongatus]
MKDVQSTYSATNMMSIPIHLAFLIVLTMAIYNIDQTWTDFLNIVWIVLFLNGMNFMLLIYFFFKQKDSKSRLKNLKMFGKFTGIIMGVHLSMAGVLYLVF